MTFLSTIIAGDVVNISLDFFVVFRFTIIIPSFTTLQKNQLVADTLILGLTIRVIIMLEI